MYTPRYASPAASLASVSAAAAGRTLHARPGRRGPRRLDRASLQRGLDFVGRFIGQHDVERGLEFFYRSRPHLRPQHRDTFEDFGGKGQPRALRTGLDFAALREIHRRVLELKEPKSAVAAAYGISIHTVAYHLAGSPSMRAALAEGQRQAA